MSGMNPMDIIAGLSADTDDTVVADVDTGATDTPVVAEDPTTQEGTENDPEDSAVETPEVDVPVEGDETPVEPTLYAGKYKTPEELENAYKHAEQRMHQEAQQRAQYEAYIQQMQEQQAAQEAEANAYDPFSTTPTNVQELIQYTYEDPDDAFWFAAQNAPGQMARVINEIRQFDNATADRLLVEHNQWQYQSQQEALQQQQAQMQEEIQRVQAQAQLPYMQQQVAGAVAKAHQNISSLANYDDVKNDMATIIKERPHLINVESESTLAIGLRDVYDLAIARNAAKIQAANTARAAAAGSAGVESGGFSEQNTAEEEDPVADLKASIYGSINRVSF